MNAQERLEIRRIAEEHPVVAPDGVDALIQSLEDRKRLRAKERAVVAICLGVPADYVHAMMDAHYLYWSRRGDASKEHVAFLLEAEPERIAGWVGSLWQNNQARCVECVAQ